MAVFLLQNNGSATLESLNLQLADVDEGGILLGEATNDLPFQSQPDACPPGAQSLPPGQQAFAAAPMASAPSGHTQRVTLQACWRNSLSGPCTQRVIEFKLP
jgi:hypothetical protein